MIGYPIDSHVTFESDGTPVYDRAVSSAPLRQLISKLFSDGILPNPSTNMQVVAGTGMNVIVYPGFAICSGCLKLEESQRTLAVQASNANYDRIDTVVLRLNDNDSERICDFYILEGTPATSPVRPTLTRTESIWEIGLADLFIAKNSTALSNQRITDTRYEAARCGVMSSISQFDTTTLYQQVQADLEEFQSVSQAEFTEWYESIKGQLSEDAAGNLQNQIGDLSNLTTVAKENIVAAINEVKEISDTYAESINSAVSKAGSAISTADLAKSTADAAKSTADVAKSTADVAKNSADSAMTSVADATETAENALIRADGALSAVNSIQTYLHFYSDMQIHPTILEWVTNSNGLAVGMMSLPYAPADGPQMKVSSVSEWIILILGFQPRMTVIAFSYGSSLTTVLKRSYWSGAWMGDWAFVQN